MSASPSPSPGIYFDDLKVGYTVATGTVEVTAEEVVAFASRYDPQPFHLDPVAARESLFGGLVASGWMTAGLTMRLMVQSEFRIGQGVVGLGIDSLRWPRPVRPGDRLAAKIEVTAARMSESKPGFGVVQITTTTTNQDSKIVQVMVSNVLVRCRPSP